MADATARDPVEDSDDEDNDADYAPSDEEALSEEDRSCGAESHSDDEAVGGAKSRKKRTRKAAAASRNSVPLTSGSSSSDVIIASPADEILQKAKADELWSSFLSSTGDRQRVSPRQSTTSAGSSVPSSSSSRGVNGKEATVKVKTVFDFAGEEVVVEKEVAASDLTKGVTKMAGKQPAADPTKARESSSEGSPASMPPSQSGAAGSKRPGGLSAVLGMIGKKPKISVLDKSKLDWDIFKQEHNITEELKTFNRGKGGYIERKSFLERADVRQFEIEKALRAGTAVPSSLSSKK